MLQAKKVEEFPNFKLHELLVLQLDAGKKPSWLVKKLNTEIYVIQHSNLELNVEVK